MKKYLFLLFGLFTIIPMSHASDGDRPRLSPADFRAKQKEFIVRDAGLTDDEAARFFPVYFELQDKKREVNDKSWQLIHNGKNDNLSESQYKAVLDGLYNTHIAIDKLEHAYVARFHRVLSYKKILRVRRAEMRFNRFIVHQMRDGGK